MKPARNWWNILTNSPWRPEKTNSKIIDFGGLARRSREVSEWRRRVSYNGITLAFQANDRGSIPLTRSKLCTILSEARPPLARRPARLMYYIYILQSIKDKRTYTGYTNNLEERLKKHDSGQVISTRYRRPLKLLLSEKYTTAKEAKKRESWWKSGAGRRKLKEFFDNRCYPWPIPLTRSKRKTQALY